jgi:hypothetical protein
MFPMNSFNFPQTLLFFLATLLSFLGLFKGQVIWDDTLIFTIQTIHTDLDWKALFTHYVWPFHEVLNAFFYRFLQADLWNWHALSLLFHLTNSSLLYMIIKRIHPRFAFLIALVFFFHPLNLINSAWIFQLKTLWTFFFLALAILFYLHHEQRPKFYWRFLSYICFVAQGLIRSNALLLPFAILLIFFLPQKSERTDQKAPYLNQKKLVSLLPYLLISALLMVRTLQDRDIYAYERTLVSQKTVLTRIPQLNLPFVIDRPSENFSSDLKVPSASAPLFNHAQTFLQRLDFTVRTFLSYHQKLLLPFPVTPLSGTLPPLVNQLPLHFIVLILFGGIFLTQANSRPYLIALFSTVIPVCGLIKFPVMDYSYISPQHFYFALPFFLLAMWQIPFIQHWVQKGYLLCVIIVFSLMNFYNVNQFRNEEAFYQASIKHAEPTILLHLNLAAAWAKNGEWRRASVHLNNILKKYPQLKKTDPYFQVGLKTQRLYEKQSYLEK